MNFMVRYVIRKLEGNRGFELHKIILSHVGLWPSLNGKQNSSLHPQYFLPRLAVFVNLVLGFIVYPMEAISKYGDITAFLESFVLSFIVSMIITKGGYFLFRHERVKQLTEKLEKLIGRSRLGTQRESEILKESQNWVNISAVVFTTLHSETIIFTFGLLPVFFYMRKFYFGTSLPFDIDIYASPTFEIILLLQCLSTLSISWPASVDIFIVSILIQTIGQFRILQYNLRNIRNLSVETVRERKAGGMGVLSITSRYLKVREAYNHPTVISTEGLFRHDLARIKITDFELNNDQEIRLEGFASTSSVSKPKTREDLEAMIPKNRNGRIEVENEVTSQVGDIDLEEIIRTNKEVAIEMERFLQECIKHHQELCRFVVEFEALFSNILMNQLICNVVPTVLAIIWATKAATITSTAVGFLLLLINCTCELFFYCWLSTKVTEESSNVRHAVYSMDWFEASESFKKSLRIIMSKANQPVVIMVAGYIPLSLETFHKVMKLAYSYYATLSTIV